MGLRLWFQCAISASLLWSVRQTLGQGSISAASTWENQEGRHPATTQSIRSSQDIRRFRSVCSPGRRCTDNSVSIRPTADCHRRQVQCQSRCTEQISQNAITPSSKQSRKDREQNFKITTSIGRHPSDMASIRARFEADLGSRTSESIELSCSSNARIATVENRISRNFNSAVGVASCIQCQPVHAHDPGRRTDATDSAGYAGPSFSWNFPDADQYCQYHACCNHPRVSTGHPKHLCGETGTDNISLWTSRFCQCQSTPRYHDTRCAEQSATKPVLSARHSASIAITHRRGHRDGTMPWQFQLATRSTCDARFGSNPKVHQSRVDIVHITCRADNHASDKPVRSSEPSVQPAQSIARINTNGNDCRCHATGFHRVVASFRTSCKWTERTSCVAGRRRGTRVNCRTCIQTSGVCEHAEVMPTATARISGNNAASTSTSSMPNMAYRATIDSNEQTGCCTTMHTSTSIRIRSERDDFRANNDPHSTDTDVTTCSQRISRFREQLSRSDCRPGRSSKCTAVFIVSPRTTTAKDCQDQSWQYPCAGSSRHRDATQFTFAHTSSDGNSIGGRRFESVGVGKGGRHEGPHATRPATHRTTDNMELPQAVQRSLNTSDRFVLSLNELIDFSQTDNALHHVTQLFHQLCQPWPRNSMIWESNFVQLLPDLNPGLRHVFQELPIWQYDDVDSVHIYVDGSSFKNRDVPHPDQAAWAFVIIVQCPHSETAMNQYYAATYSPLSTATMSKTEYHGVGELNFDSQSSEASGMIMAMCWTLQSPFQCQHVIHYDNTTIGLFAAGIQRWEAGWEHEYLHSNLHSLRHLFHVIGLDVLYEHVKAHDQHPMNEVADSLAKATAKGIMPVLALPAIVSQVMMNRHFRYTWMTASNPAVIPRPLALRGLFKAEGPFSKESVDTTWWHNDFTVTTEDVTLCFTVATANVLTLAPGTKAKQIQGLMQKGRISTLQQQFHQAGTHIIGLQECRTQMAITRHSPTHWVYQSGAAPDGSRGCELWLSKQQPYASSPKMKHYFRHEHVHVAAYSDRYILAILNAPHLHIRILVLHAPHAASQDVDVESWWQTIQQMINRICTSLPIIVLGDMNAKLGSVSSDSVGSYAPEQESLTGHLLHALLLESRLWAPSTFEEHHQGTSFTWTSCDGLSHRLDFVLLPIHWKAYHVQSYVAANIDLCTAKEDHAVACVDLSMAVAKSKRQHLEHVRIDANTCKDKGAQQQFIQYLSTPPTIPWEVGVGLHAELVTSWLQQGAQQCFRRTKQQPRQRYMSELTWQIVQLRKQLRKMMMRAEAHVRLIVLRKFFGAWTFAQHNKISQHDTCSVAPMHETTSCQQARNLRHLAHQCRCVFAWTFFHRNHLHAAARQASRQDRITVSQEIIDQFLTAARGTDTKTLYRSLQPLLGQTHRRKLSMFRPVPAVRLADNTLANDPTAAAHRWQSHFAEAKQGNTASVQQLQELARLEAPCYKREQLPFDFSSLPSLQDIETYIHKARKGKSPGVDGLPSEVYKVAPSAMAHILWPAMAKAAIRCSEPLRWRGGEICALAKVPHAGHQVEHFRSILLADFSSKIYHGIARQKLLPSIQQYRLNLQAGGRHSRPWHRHDAPGCTDICTDQSTPRGVQCLTFRRH